MDSISENVFERLHNLPKLEHLSSLKLPSRLWHSVPFSPLIRSILPRLRRLVAGDALFDNPLPRLRHLKLMRCHCSEIKNLFNIIFNVRSLDITLVNCGRVPWPKEIQSLVHLDRFFLKVNGEMTIIEIKDILFSMPSLRHFQLETDGNIDLIDGQQWESIVSRLITFNFRFHLLIETENKDVLNSFRSPFWLDYKRWFVAYDDQLVFTIPCFAPKDAKWSSEYRTSASTVSNLNLDQYVERLNLAFVCPTEYRFRNLTSLVLETKGRINMFNLFDFIQDRPHLSSLTISNSLLFDSLPKNIICEQIRSLHVRHVVDDQHQLDPKCLCTIFPRIEYLNIRIQSRQALRTFIDRLKYLSFAYFHLSRSVSKWCCFRQALVTRQWLIQNTQRLSQDRSFTSAINNRTIRLWMNDGQKPSSFFTRLFKSNHNRHSL